MSEINIKILFYLKAEFIACIREDGIHYKKGTD